MLNLISNALKEERSFPFQEMTILNRQGERVPVGVNISVLKERGKGDKERFRGIAVILSDLAETKKIREDLRRTDQLAAIGSLAAGLAHEIRNPLGSIHGMVELLKEDIEEGDPRKIYTDSILRTVDRLNKLVEELLDFSHPSSSELKPQDLNKMLKEAVLSSKYTAQGKELELTEDYERDLPKVLADSEKLIQAFHNIIQNAFQATPDYGCMTICTRSQGPSENIIIISNTGSYISPEIKHKIFNPFFTTKSEGTGLGLSIAYHIIAAHSGSIDVESDLEKGTTFSITLPTAGNL